MTNFELFSLIYFVLDAEYDSSDKSDEQLMHFVSELNPFLWADESSADPAYFEEFKSFMKDKTIGSDMGYSLALEFLSNDIYYSKIPEYFKKQVLMNGFLLQKNIYQNHIKVMASKKKR